MKELGISIYEDNKKLREELAYFINSQEGMQVINTYPNGLHIQQDLQMAIPDVVIMDIDMPGISGVEAVETIKRIHPEVQIIMYTVFEDNAKLFAALCAGADGYILKRSSPQDLILAIKDVYTGGVPLSPSIARKMLRSFQQEKLKPDQFQLSDRELQVLGLLTKGYSYKQIAADCFVTLDTIRKHLQNIYNKLHVNCGTEAVAKALKYRLVRDYD